MKAVCIAAALLALPAHAQTPAAEAPQIGQVSKDSVWVPTPERMIRCMLQLADATKDDLVIDLGSGDGRIRIHAAKHFGARAIEVELEGNLVDLATEAAGVSSQVRFLQQDLFEADLSEATVVALYISPGVMTRLKPKLLALKPGTRVVSHHFTLEEREPDETIRLENRTGYLWVVPTDAKGARTVRLPGDEFMVRFEQVRPELRSTGERSGRAFQVIAPKRRGTEVSFTAIDPDGSARHYRGWPNIGGVRRAWAGAVRLAGLAPLRTAVRGPG